MKHHLVEAGVRRYEEEQETLTAAIKVALHTFMEICSSEEPTEVRIDAASRILGFAASFGVVTDEDLDDEEDNYADDDEPDADAPPSE